jgi:spore maturation protein CgeB
VQADFVVTQLPREPAEWLYARQGKERIISAPHALNNKVFRCIVDPDSRGIDIGFIGDRYHLSVGDTERERLIEYFINEVDSGLKKDIRIPRLAGSGRRLVRQKYVNFLNSAKGTIAAESGTYYLDKTGQLQREIENYLKKYPGVSFKEISEQVIKNFHKPTVNGKAISSRHFEAVGTKTCQILLEGKYNDIFKPDMHYISLKKDFSNIKDVLQRFKDVTYRRQMVDSAYDYVMDSHTYGSRISYILDKVGL